MAWGSKVQIMTGQAVAGTEIFSSYVTLNPGELAHIQVKADFPVSPDDDLEVRVYGTLDASSEDSDNQSGMATILDKADDPAFKSILVSGYYKFRLGAIRSGSTDTITTDMWRRIDGVSL